MLGGRAIDRGEIATNIMPSEGTAMNGCRLSSGSRVGYGGLASGDTLLPDLNMANQTCDSM